MEQEQRKFRADPLMLKRRRVEANLTQLDIQKKTGLSKDTIRKILSGKPVFLNSIAEMVSVVFNIENPADVLHPEERAELGIRTEVSTDGHILEWKIEEYLSGWKETSNGLQFQLAKLNHRFLDGRVARGKCYELRHMTTAERDKVETHLQRHADVCDMIGQHPNIARNITAAYVNDLWWVLDTWDDGELLAERLSNDRLSEYELKYIMTGIANGLAKLHDEEIIRRELTPASVILLASSDRPILTDMELAKIAGSGATVAPNDWPDDPYRALEVTGNTPLDARADIYSWARIFVHAATGSICEKGDETLPEGDMIPPMVRDVLLQAVELLPDNRPTNMKTILAALERWI